jgi:hypothetical protein
MKQQSWKHAIETKRRKAVLCIQIKTYSWELLATMVLALWIKQTSENKTLCRESERGVCVCVCVCVKKRER